MDGPRDYHTKWSKSDVEKQISYDITYMWNLKKWNKWTYLQNRNKLIDIEKKNLQLSQGIAGEVGRREIRSLGLADTSYYV